MFRDGRAEAALGENRAGIIDTQGKWIVPPEYREARPEVGDLWQLRQAGAQTEEYLRPSALASATAACSRPLRAHLEVAQDASGGYMAGPTSACGRSRATRRRSGKSPTPTSRRWAAGWASSAATGSATSTAREAGRSRPSAWAVPSSTARRRARAAPGPPGRPGRPPGRHAGQYRGHAAGRRLELADWLGLADPAAPRGQPGHGHGLLRHRRQASSSCRAGSALLRGPRGESAGQRPARAVNEQGHVGPVTTSCGSAATAAQGASGPALRLR